MVPSDYYNLEVYVSDSLNYINIIWNFYQKASDYDMDSAKLYKGKYVMSCEPDCCGMNRNKNYSVNDLIFRHDFAEAFFGNKMCMVDVGSSFPHYKNMKEYEYHLQQMVLEKEPLKYLEKFLCTNFV